MENPKLFISYSWSNPSHEQWVIDLANDLSESGVHVILDKWDLKEGHDAIAFMEKMVTDPDIKKVALICDEIYAAKADGRLGGVGTETQIISRRIYEGQDQDKFVAIITEKDNQGKAFLPTYFNSRIYIDLSESDKYSENFEKLLRWIYNKPLHKRPDIGKRPSFLDEAESVSLGTTASFKRTISAIKENKPSASGSLDEYLTLFSENIENFRVIKDSEKEFDDLVISNIEDFIPYRNEAISLFIAIAQYSPTEENILKLHRFFERLIPYMYRPQSMNYWEECDFDNFKFIIHELFLYLVAIFTKNEKFDLLNKFLTQQYYSPSKSNYNKELMTSYETFSEHLGVLDHRNRRLKLNKLSLRAALLKERNAQSGIDFKHLMQADFILFMRSEIKQTDIYSRWFPETLLYLDRFNSAFEVFARSSSKSYFEKSKVILGISKPSDLDKLMDEYKKDRQSLPKWKFETINPANLIGYQQLATQP
ncbi:SEFIR domain-containing protein [Pseudomonas luteola]|uniref:SEFIR domain-containing protein n=1 Tax=Pseudomonas luteola TaxID=47886 RepID=UPI0012391685|nr:SEFIR domain-containing protein [Pseudomonas luteola]QEU31564.1 hypothetical protein FOB45_27820 [Pseudomonas luteola]